MSQMRLFWDSSALSSGLSVSLEEGFSTGRFDSDRGGLYGTADPKAESPGGGFGPKGKASKSVAKA